MTPDTDRTRAGRAPAGSWLRQRDEAFAAGCLPVFGGHRGYPPKFGALYNAYLEVSKDGGLYTRADAPVRLRVSKEGARSVRYWTRAFKLIEDRKDGQAAPTARARWLFGDPDAANSADPGGADPWLEEPESHWLLNWWLLEPPCLAPAWWLALAARPGNRFSPADLGDRIRQASAAAGWKEPSVAAAARDAACFTSMYRADPDGNDSIEETLMHPFRQLGVLVPSRTGKDRWRFAGTCPPDPAITTYACLDYAARNGRAASGTIELGRLAAEPGSPGQVLLMNETGIAEDLDRISAGFPGLTVTSAVGMRTLEFSGDPAAAAWNILGSRYGRPASPELLQKITAGQRAAQIPAPGGGLRSSLPGIAWAGQAQPGSRHGRPQASGRNLGTGTTPPETSLG